MSLSEQLFGALALRDIHDCTDVFGEGAGLVQHRVAQGVEMFDRPVWEDSTMLNRIIAFLAKCPLESLLHKRPIFGVNQLKSYLLRKLRGCRIEAVDAIHFL